MRAAKNLRKPISALRLAAQQPRHCSSCTTDFRCGMQHGAAAALFPATWWHMCVECGSLFRCVYPRSAPTYLHKLRHSSYWQLQCRQFTAKIVRNNYEHHTVTRICLNEAALVVTKRAHYWRCLSSLVASLSQRCLLIRWFIIVRLVCSILYFFFFCATDICIYESTYVLIHARALENWTLGNWRSALWWSFSSAPRSLTRLRDIEKERASFGSFASSAVW